MQRDDSDHGRETGTMVSRRRVSFLSAILLAPALILSMAGPASAWKWVPNHGDEWGTGEYVAEPGDTGPAPTQRPIYSWQCYVHKDRNPDGTWTPGYYEGAERLVYGGEYGTYTTFYGVREELDYDPYGNNFRATHRSWAGCWFTYDEVVPRADGLCRSFNYNGGMIGHPSKGYSSERCSTPWDVWCYNAGGKWHADTEECIWPEQPNPDYAPTPIERPEQNVSEPGVKTPATPTTRITQCSQANVTVRATGNKVRNQTKAKARHCVTGPSTREAKLVRQSQKQAFKKARAKAMKKYWAKAQRKGYSKPRVKQRVVLRSFR